MIKVKLFESYKHRNETTFRPYVYAQNQLREIGIYLVGEDVSSYDIALVGQASIIDKKLSLNESSERGIKFCEQFGSNYIIFDGQDSHSLIGIIEVLRGVSQKPLLVLKNSLLSDFDLYKNGYVNGRLYWGKGDYSIPDIDKYKDIIELSGTNWLSTVTLDFSRRYSYEKHKDVSALFGRGLTSGNEHGLDHYMHYNLHRLKCVSELEKIDNITYEILPDGERISESEYYTRMLDCKIILAPFGFGEIAPRDIQSAAMGSILIKPNMSHIKTLPNPYIPYHTYIPCRHDFTDLDEAIDSALDKGTQPIDSYVENLKNNFEKMNKFENLAVHLHGLLTTKLSSIVGTE
jgi:hypothetical protein